MFGNVIFKVTNWLNQGDPNWSIRRRMAFIIMSYAMVMVTYGALGCPLTEMTEANRMALAAALIADGRTIFVTTLGTYIAGAIADDASQRKYGIPGGATKLPMPETEPTKPGVGPAARRTGP